MITKGQRIHPKHQTIPHSIPKPRLDLQKRASEAARARTGETESCTAGTYLIAKEAARIAGGPTSRAIDPLEGFRSAGGPLDALEDEAEAVGWAADCIYGGVGLVYISVPELYDGRKQD